MPLEPKDILLAFKHIALSDQLNGTEKQFAAFLIDCYNRKTGRCDPSEETAAYVLRRHKRSIIRAGNRLVSLKLFLKRRHAGNNHCNHYQPNWETFRERERAYKQLRSKYAKRFEHAKLSPSECQPCHSRDDNPVTQTSSTNNIQSTSLDRPSHQRHDVGDGVGLTNQAKVVAASSPSASHDNFQLSRRDRVPVADALMLAQPSHSRRKVKPSDVENLDSPSAGIAASEARSLSLIESEPATASRVGCKHETQSTRNNASDATFLTSMARGALKVLKKGDTTGPNGPISGNVGFVGDTNAESNSAEGD
jgi:hypothetical protein